MELTCFAEQSDQRTNYEKSLFENLETLKLKKITGRGCYLMVVYDSFDKETERFDGEKHIIYNLDEYELVNRKINNFVDILGFETVAFSQNPKSRKILAAAEKQVKKTLPIGTKLYSAKDLENQKSKLLSLFFISRSLGLTSSFTNFKFNEKETIFNVPFQITLFIKKGKTKQIISKMKMQKANYCS